MDALLLKASLLLSLSLIAARLMRRAPAATRHRLWTLAFAAVLALPLLASALPALYVPVPAAWHTPTALRSPLATFLAVPDSRSPRATTVRSGIHEAATSRSGASGAGASASGPTAAPLAAIATKPVTGSTATSGATRWRLVSASNAAALLLIVWLSGTILATATLLASLLRARRLARGGGATLDASWRDAADALGTRLGLRAPVQLIVNPSVTTPMAGGLWRHIIFLPSSAHGWSAEQRDIVLAHEIAHLAGLDPLRHVLARLAVALYWFHPLAWLAAREATVAREQACDEAVLALGTRPSAYARVLLDLAESMHGHAPALAAPALGALPMVERSLLETRLMAILNHDARPAAARRVLMPALGVVLLTLCVAAAQPATTALTRRAATPAIADVSGTHATASTSATPAIAPYAATVPHAASAADDATTPVIAASATAGSPGSIAAMPVVARAGATGVTAAVAAQPGVQRDSACWWEPRERVSFRGNMSTRFDAASGRDVAFEQVGTRGSDRVILKHFDDVLVCMVAEGAGDRDGDREVPSQWLGRARRVVMEAHRGGALQRLEITGQQTSWRVGGVERAFDAAAQQWRDRMLAVLDTTWELSMLRGEVSGLRGEISGLRGQESGMRGEISGLRGDVSALRGQISGLRGTESGMRGQIAAIDGHLNALRGSLAAERGAIASIQGSRYSFSEADDARLAARLKEHQARIAQIEQSIRDYDAPARIAAVERDIAALRVNDRIAGLEADIRAIDVNGKIAMVERRIAELDVQGKTAAIERKIEALDADRRGRELEAKRDAALKQLDAAIAAIR